MTTLDHAAVREAVRLYFELTNDATLAVDAAADGASVLAALFDLGQQNGAATERLRAAGKLESTTDEEFGAMIKPQWPLVARKAGAGT